GVPPDAMTMYILAGVLIGLGAAAQAATGAILLYKSVGTSVRLERLDEIILFMFVGVLGSALVGASVGVGTLVFTGSIQHSEAFFSWLTWYCGDALGMVAFSPLLVLLLSRNGTMRRKIMVGLPLIIIFSAVIIMFFSVRYW